MLWFEGLMRYPLMDDVDRQVADLLALLIGDEDGVVTVLHVRPDLQHTPCDRIGAVHGFDVIGQLGVTGIEASSNAPPFRGFERRKR
jgi:hypothetical protein